MQRSSVDRGPKTTNWYTVSNSMLTTKCSLKRECLYPKAVASARIILSSSCSRADPSARFGGVEVAVTTRPVSGRHVSRRHHRCTADAWAVGPFISVLREIPLQPLLPFKPLSLGLCPHAASALFRLSGAPTTRPRADHARASLPLAPWLSSRPTYGFACCHHLVSYACTSNLCHRAQVPRAHPERRQSPWQLWRRSTAPDSSERWSWRPAASQDLVAAEAGSRSPDPERRPTERRAH